MASHRRGIVAFFALVSLVGSLLAPPAGASHSVDSNCPAFVMPGEISRGMRGTGYTVAEERTRETFSVEVLGVLKDALGPGRDMIVIEASGDVIEDNGGVWAGMSGSPVFVGEELLGAVAFGLAFGPANVAGLTPASEMYKVMEYPEDADASATPVMPRRVSVPSFMQRRIAYAARMEMSQVGSSLRQLKVPVSISGVSRSALDRIAEVIARENLPLIPFAGAAAPSKMAASSERVRAGDNLAVAASYGDVTFAAVGTATFVCDGQAMAFGHPFLWEGNATLGANAATAVTVVPDAFVPYELATIDVMVGVVDQDRFAGVRAAFGLQAPTIPITSSIHAENIDRSRDGLTEVMLSEFLPFLAYFHLSSNLVMTMDQYSEGSASLAWTIQGTDAEGDPWTFERSNVYSSEWGIADEATFEISNVLNALLFNRFEDIEFTSVDVAGIADDEIEQYTLTGVQVSRNGQTYSDRQRVRARPGSTIYLRLELQPYAGAARTVDLSIDVPTTVRTNGFIEIVGGGDLSEEGEICLYDPAQCTDAGGKKLETFEDLLASLDEKPKNNELVASFRAGRRARVKARASLPLDQVVRGQAFIFVRVPGSKGGGGAPGGGSEVEPPIQDRAP